MMMKNLAVTSWFALTGACNAITPDLLSKQDAAVTPMDSSPGMDMATGTPEPGLILRYAFEDTGTTATDSSGRGKDGTVLDDPGAQADVPTAMAWTAEGRSGRGLALTGTQFVALPNGVLTDVDDFTIATWVRVRTAADWARIYDFGNAAGDFMYLTISGFAPGVMPPDPTGVHASSYGGSAANEHWFGTETRLPTLVWKHVAITGTGGDRRVYIDGFPVAARLGGPNVPPRQMEPMSPNSWIGRSRFNDQPPVPDPKLNASLDEFRIYNRVLTPTEIADLAWPQRDYSYFRFNESSGTSVKDSSDHAIVATASDVTWTTGRMGNAVKLSGGSSGASGPHISLATSPLAACNEFTVSLWIKPDAIDGARIFDFGSNTTDTFMFLTLHDGTGLHLGMAAPGKPAFHVSAPTSVPVDGQWHHVAVTLQSGTGRIFIDGVQRVMETGAMIRPTDLGATTQNYIGRSRAGDNYLSASLDEMRFACRAFTADEIVNLSRP